MEEKTSIYDLAFNKIADMEAAINYISTLSKIYDQRMSVFIWPPQGDKGRFISVEMGFGRSGVRIFGEEGNLFIRWYDEAGQEQKEPFIDGKTIPDSVLSIMSEEKPNDI